MGRMLNTLVPDVSGFQPVRAIDSAPVPDETALLNIEHSATVDFPTFRAESHKTHRGTLIFVAGGPTLRDHVEEIRARQLEGVPIMTSNNTHDWLVDRGIIADYCMLIDPKKGVAKYIKQPQITTKYFIGTSCAPEVFAAFAGFQVEKLLVAYGCPANADIKLQFRLYPRARTQDYLVGGTMTPLRAMPFARQLGFDRLEFYGFDSCYAVGVPPLVYEKDNPQRFKELALEERFIYSDVDDSTRYIIDEPADGGYFYAYSKRRPEDITVAEIAGRRFLTSPAFAYQAKQIAEWAERLEGRLEVVIHGDSLSSYLLEVRRNERLALLAQVGDRRWTDEYKAQQSALHLEGHYGIGSAVPLPMLATPILGMYERFKRTITAIDYGCGDGSLAARLHAALKVVEVTNYDPMQERWGGDKEVGMHDWTFCIDVMEHVEEQCVANVIKWIADRTRYGAYFDIALGAAVKNLPDGRNAHITLHTPEWWAEQLRPHFNITEMQETSSHVKIACERHGAHERASEESQ